ncbi:hypothetical protein LRS56_27155 [Pseudomonas poae]|nr:hypothetical protein LRS56_27155 [Pseudomonas poae]
MTSIASTPHFTPPLAPPQSSSTVDNRPPTVEHFGNTKITTHPDKRVNYGPDQYTHAIQVDIETGNTNDNIILKQLVNNRIIAEINGVDITLGIDNSDHDGVINIKTAGGNDNVTVAPGIKLLINISTGAGDDTVKTGGGKSTVDLGDGNDHGELGPGGGTLRGGRGDDILKSGNGLNKLEGNEGFNSFHVGSEKTDKEPTWISAKGDADGIVVHSGPAHIINSSKRAFIYVQADVDTTIRTLPQAGATNITIDGKAEDGKVKFTGRRDSDKDNIIYKSDDNRAW